MYCSGIHDKNTCNVFKHDLIRVSDTPSELYRTWLQMLYTISNSVLIYALSKTASFWRIVPLEKSNTSSDSNLRMFSAFSHLASFSVALLQMSWMKFFHEFPHSNFTIEMRVEFSLLSRCCVSGWPFNYSGKFRTKLTMKLRIFILLSSSRICHLI